MKVFQHYCLTFKQSSCPHLNALQSAYFRSNFDEPKITHISKTAQSISCVYQLGSVSKG